MRLGHAAELFKLFPGQLLASTTVMAAMLPLASVDTSTVMFAIGATGESQTFSSRKVFCCPLTRISPGVLPGTLITVPRILISSFVCIYPLL